MDWIKVTLVAGTTYQFDVYGLGSGDGTLAASVFGLRDSSGQPITPFVSSGGPPGGAEFTYTALSSGDYFINEQALSSQQLGTYKITVAQISTTLLDDYTASPATTGFVPVGGTTTGSIETTGDVDWIKVTLVAGTTYQFDVYGLGSGDGTLAASVFGLRDSSGQPITPFVSSGGPPGGAEFTYTALSSGDYFINEQALSSQQLGTYKITVAQISTTLLDDYTASPATTGFVPVGGTTTGSIETTGDVDWIKVTLVAGTTYQFDVYGLGSGDGTLAASVFGLRDSSGQPITPFVSSGGPPGGAEFTYTALSSGDYFINEQALSSQQLGTYKLTVAQIGSAVAVADVASIKEDTAPNPVTGNVLANDQDADGDTLTVTNAGTFNLGHGTLALKADGSYAYTLDNTNPAVNALNDGQTLTDAFTYQISDGHGGTSSAALTVTIHGTTDTPVNTPPTAVADAASIKEDTLLNPVTGNVLANDQDADGDTLTVTNAGTFNLGHGTLALKADGSYAYTLDNTNPAVNALNDGQTLTDAFTYQISDGHGGTSSAALTVTIHGTTDIGSFSPEIAATIAYAAEYGEAPNATELGVLVQFVDAQYAYGQHIGVMDPSVLCVQVARRCACIYRSKVSKRVRAIQPELSGFGCGRWAIRDGCLRKCVWAPRQSQSNSTLCGTVRLL